MRLLEQGGRNVGWGPRDWDMLGISTSRDAGMWNQTAPTWRMRKFQCKIPDYTGMWSKYHKIVFVTDLKLEMPPLCPVRQTKRCNRGVQSIQRERVHGEESRSDVSSTRFCAKYQNMLMCKVPQYKVLNYVEHRPGSTYMLLNLICFSFYLFGSTEWPDRNNYTVAMASITTCFSCARGWC